MNKRSSYYIITSNGKKSSQVIGVFSRTAFVRLMHFSWLIERPKIPKLDLGFAVSVGSSDADAKLQKIKDTIEAVIDRYGKNSIRYSFTFFGNEPSRVVRFAESELYTIESLKNRVDRLSIVSGSALDKALEDARKMFEDTARPDARKVFVVIMDQGQSSDPDKTKENARDLGVSGIKIVPVALGKEADPDELTQITTNKDDLVNVEKDEDPEKAAEKIMIKILEGMSSVQQAKRLTGQG